MNFCYRDIKFVAKDIGNQVNTEIDIGCFFFNPPKIANNEKGSALLK